MGFLCLGREFCRSKGVWKEKVGFDNGDSWLGEGWGSWDLGWWMVVKGRIVPGGYVSTAFVVDSGWLFCGSCYL